MYVLHHIPEHQIRGICRAVGLGLYPVLFQPLEQQTFCVFISTFLTPDNQLLKVKCSVNLETLLNVGTYFTNYLHFQSLEVVCRGSETQLQVTEN